MCYYGGRMTVEFVEKSSRECRQQQLLCWRGIRWTSCAGTLSRSATVCRRSTAGRRRRPALDSASEAAAVSHDFHTSPIQSHLSTVNQQTALSYVCSIVSHTSRGVARNFLQGGDKRGGLGDGSPPAGSRGRAPVGVWGQSPQKPETNANFQLRRGNMHPCPPLATPLLWHIVLAISTLAIPLHELTSITILYLAFSFSRYGRVLESILIKASENNNINSNNIYSCSTYQHIHTDTILTHLTDYVSSFY